MSGPGWNQQEAANFMNRRISQNSSEAGTSQHSVHSPHTPNTPSPSHFTSMGQANRFASSAHLQSSPSSRSPFPTPSHTRTTNLPVRRDSTRSIHSASKPQQKPIHNMAPEWSFGRADQAPLTPATNSPSNGVYNFNSPAASGASGTRPPSSSSDKSRKLGLSTGDSLGKRRREIEADSSLGPKSKRPTPDPGVGRAPSMSREDSNDLALADLYDGIDPTQDLATFKSDQARELEQIRQERARREEQVRADAEYALKLQQEWDGAAASDTQRPVSNQARSTQSVFGQNGKVRRPSPPAPSPVPSPVKAPISSYYGHGSNGLNPGQNIASSNAPIRKTDPSFTRLDSDDDDIQILDTRPVDPASRNQFGRTLPWASTNNATANTATRPQHIDLSNDSYSANTLNTNGLHSSSGAPGIPGNFRLPGISSLSSYQGSASANAQNNVYTPAGYMNAGRVMPGAWSSYDSLDSQNAAFGDTPTGFSSGASNVFGNNYGNYNSSNSVIQPGTFESSWAARFPYVDPDYFASSRFNPLEIYARDPDFDFEGYNDVDNSEALKDLMNNIRPDEDLGSDDRNGTPEGMADTANLYKYQQKGLAWLSKMEEGSNKGSILADDMGLGKTIQAIALMVSRRSEDPTCKTNLIVAPVALIRQWESEIASKVRRSHELKTFLYHGNTAEKKKATHKFLREYDVVITTYGALQVDMKKKLTIDKARKSNPNYRPKPSDCPVLLGSDCKWHRLILDEAQNIKNKAAKTSQAAYELQSTYRLVMTGTPMMNGPVELYSLIHFLRIKPYNHWEKFSREIAKPIKHGTPKVKQETIKKLQALLKAIMLRRTKKSTMNGKPLVELPERRLEVEHAIFDDEQRAFYDALESRTQLQFNKYMKAGTVGKHYSNVLTLLLRLRQAACHPHLIKDFAVSVDASPEDLLEAARGLPEEAVQRLIENGIVDCPVCMDASDNYTIFHPCGHNTCPECFCRLADSAQNQAAANDGSGRAPFNCHSCRATIDPKLVTDYEHFKRIHQPALAAEEGLADIGGDEESDDDSDDSDESDDDSEAEENEDDSSDLKDFVVDDDELVAQASDSDDGDDLDEVKPVRPQSKGKTVKAESSKAKKVKNEDVFDDDFIKDEPGYSKGSNPFEKANGKKLKKFKKMRDSKGKGKEKKRNSRKTLAQLKKDAMRNKKARRAYMKRLAKDYVPSAKTEKCMEILQRIQDAGEGEKTIVFSQFTSLLDLVEIPMNKKRDWMYTRFDGSMNAKERNDSVQLFTKDPRCKIMLVSLKAGNAGLNLTAANHVIILDPFWNPYIEEQAIDRAHRIGQRRAVQIHRVLVEATVEDRIIELQEKKRETIEGALDEGAAQTMGRLGVQELARLFGVRQ